MWARNGRWILPEMTDFHVAFSYILHAVNLRHETDGFTSPPKEGVLRIFLPWKIQRLRPGLNPRTWVPKASTLPLDHRSLLAPSLFIYGAHTTVCIKAVTSLNLKDKQRFSTLIRVEDKMVVGCESASKYCVAQATQIFCSVVSYVLKPYNAVQWKESWRCTQYRLLLLVDDSFVYRASHRVLQYYISAA